MAIKPGKDELTVEGACLECMRMGFFVSHSDKYGEQVERCDACGVFRDDDEAQAHMLRLAAQTLKDPKPRSGKRFKMLLECLEAHAEQTAPSFWIGGPPNPEWLRKRVRTLASRFTGLDGATMLSIAYDLQDSGFIRAPHGEENEDHEELDRTYLRDQLDRDELARMLRNAGCEETREGNWRVKK